MTTLERKTDKYENHAAPGDYEALAKDAQDSGRWHDAARLWQKAAAVTLGHFRAGQYEHNAYRAARRALSADLLEEAIERKPMLARTYHKIRGYLDTVKI